MARTIGFIGSGAVAGGLARLAVQNGCIVVSVSGRNSQKAALLAAEVSASHHGTDPEDTLQQSDTVFFCLPDSALAGEIEKLSGTHTDLSGKILFHTSGALSSALFDPLRIRGAKGASFHPLQTFPRTGGEASLRGYAVALEGDGEAVRLGKELAEKFGAEPMELSASRKILYHSAATLASNGLVALAGVIEELHADLESGSESIRYFYKLMEQSLKNSANFGAVKALTGPAARGDIATIKNHLRELRSGHPHIIPLYVILGSHCVHLAVTGGGLQPVTGEEILDLFSKELQSLTM